MRVSFTVRGLPAPQGSKRHVGNGIMVEQGGVKLRTWRQDVKAAAWEVMRFETSGNYLTGPVGVSVCFTLPKPKSAPKRRRTWPDRRPDLDKLLRSTLDGLTGEVFADDAQVVAIEASKCYPGEPVWVRGGLVIEVPGAVITAWQIGDGDGDG